MGCVWVVTYLSVDGLALARGADMRRLGGELHVILFMNKKHFNTVDSQQLPTNSLHRVGQSQSAENVDPFQMPIGRKIPRIVIG